MMNNWLDLQLKERRGKKTRPQPLSSFSSLFFLPTIIKKAQPPARVCRPGHGALAPLVLSRLLRVQGKKYRGRGEKREQGQTSLWSSFSLFLPSLFFFLLSFSPSHLLSLFSFFPLAQTTIQGRDRPRGLRPRGQGGGLVAACRCSPLGLDEQAPAAAAAEAAPWMELAPSAGAAEGGRRRRRRK